MIVWSRGLAKSRVKLKPLYTTNYYKFKRLQTTTSSRDNRKPLYLYYQSFYGHQTLQYGNLPWWVPTNKVILALDHVILQNHIINQNHLSLLPLPIVTRLGRMVTYLEGLLTIKPYNTLISWFCKITWETKTIVFLIQECQTWKDGNVTLMLSYP